MLNTCIFLKTVIKLCYMNWHLVKLYAMEIKCKTFVIPLSIFQNVFIPLFVPFCENGPYICMVRIMTSYLTMTKQSVCV